MTSHGDPYQAPGARLEDAPAAPPSLAASVLRALAFALTALVSFLLGCVVTVLAMFRVFAPPADCPSPCDGPAYAALGASMFVAPVVGLLFAGGGVFALSRLWRRSAGPPARPPGEQP